MTWAARIVREQGVEIRHLLTDALNQVCATQQARGFACFVKGRKHIVASVRNDDVFARVFPFKALTDRGVVSQQARVISHPFIVSEAA